MESTTNSTTTPASETPPNVPVVDPAAQTSGSGDSWMDEALSGDLGLGEDPTLGKEGVGSSEPKPKGEETPSKVEKPVAPVKLEVETPKAPATPTTPAASDTPQAPSPSAESSAPQPTEGLIAVEQQRKEFEGKLIEHYAVSEEDAVMMISEPEKVLPRLLAKTHMTAMGDALRVMQARLPQLLAHYQTESRSRETAADSFFKEWPELKEAIDQDPKRGEVVARVMQGYRQANQKMPPEDIIKEGGLAALVALKLPIPKRLLTVHNMDQPPATQREGYSPPGGSAPRVSGAQPGSDNLFTVMAVEDLQER